MMTNRHDHTAMHEELSWLLRTGAKLLREILIGLALGATLFLLVWIADASSQRPDLQIKDCSQVPVEMSDDLC